MAFFRAKIPALAIYVGIFVAWWLVTAFGWVEPIILPSPRAVGGAFREMTVNGSLLKDLGVTGGRVLAALVIASIIGIPLGLFFGYQKKIYEMVEGPLHALRSVPATCLFPLLLIVIGVGEKSIITLAAYPCLLILMVNAATGASLAEPSRVRQGRILGLTPFNLITEVLFFEALPHVTSALRTSVSYALVLVVAVEMFIGVGQSGLGRKIFDYQSSFRIPETYAEILVTGALGVALNISIGLLEKRLLRWLPQTANVGKRSS
ncbi:MAG TPA: ABC transporter permease [Candidatus Paceibacterota bacterium]|nr:ABC transporter permease [Candidatus Paceibacterota bacterium]